MALTFATRTVVLQLEEDLRRLDACCGGEGAGWAFARAFVDEVVRPVPQVVEALRDFVDRSRTCQCQQGESTGRLLQAKRPCPIRRKLSLHMWTTACR
jgi:hypothetical protein